MTQKNNAHCLLEKELILGYINTHTINYPIHLHLAKTIDSTNRFLRKLEPTGGVNICCAEEQTQGRGRFERTWYSPFAENIYCSSRWPIQQEHPHLSSLSLVTSLAIIATLEELDLHHNLKIKWPNDILWNQKKLSGCLIELIKGPHIETEVIIGIGLNVNSETEDHPLTNKAWCSLFDITGHTHDRNLIIGKLINHLHHHIDQLLTHGFEDFLEQWNRVDGLKGQWITLTEHSKVISGLALGVNLSGQLILLDSDQHTHYFSSGDTSLSLQKY